MVDTYRSIDPSDAALAINGIAAEPYRSIDPSDIVSAIKEVDPNVRDLDRADALPVVNEIAGGGAPPDGGGGEPEPPAPVAILSLWNTNPAKVVVGAADLAKFSTDDVVTVAGVLPPNDAVNGSQTVGSVLADGFELVGVDLTANLDNIADPGMTVTPAAAP